MKKGAGVFIGMLLFLFVLSAREASGEEISNQADAIISAQPGDYILLSSGNRYVLTKEEIMIAGGTFGYADIINAPSETRADGTVIKTISQAHKVRIYPTGKTIHVLKTRAAFAYSLKFIEDNYYLMHYIDSTGVLRDSKPIAQPGFYVFRVFIQTETITNGVDELTFFIVSVYNHEGENYVIKYCTVPDMVWGLVSSETAEFVPASK
jgi:hypothetical protein